MFDLYDLYLSHPMVACFDGEGDEGDGGDGDEAATAAAAAAEAASGVGGGKGKLFTQEEVNKLNAADRRKDRETLAKLEEQLKSLQTNKSLTEQERASLQANLDEVSGRLRTKEDEAKREKQRLEEQLQNTAKEWEQRYSELDSRYRSETIKRSWQDALGPDAFNLSQTVAMMSSQSKLVPVIDEKTKKETGQLKIVVELDDEDSEGKPTVSTMTPVEAVARMKELKHKYGYLFKTNVVAGVGGSNTTGGLSGNGDVDLKKLAQDPEQYRKMRKERPDVLYGQR